MGDRAVFGFRANEQAPTIFIYQHWVNGEQEVVLAEVLECSRERWYDNSYATRICISQIVGDRWSDSLGYGIYTGETSHGSDYEYVFIVDWERQSVMKCYNSDSDVVLEEVGIEEFLETTARR